MPQQEGSHLVEAIKPRFFYGYVVVGAAFFVNAVAWGAYFTFGVFLEPVLNEFHWSRAVTSGAFSLSLIVFGFLSIVIGRLSDRFGPRVITAVCGVFLGGGYLLMSKISAPWQLYLVYGVIIGTGLSVAWVPLTSAVARWFVKGRGLMTGIFMNGIAIGKMAMPPLASSLISTYHWRTSYIIVGIITLVLIVLAAPFLRRDPAQMGLLPYGGSEVKAESMGLPVRGSSFSQAIRTGQFWMLGGMFFCALFCLYAVSVHIVIHATGLGISPASAANIFVVMGALNIAGRLVIGSAADRIGGKLSFIIVFILLSLAFFCLVGARELWMLYLFAAIFGFAHVGVPILASTTAAELYGLGSHGIILGAMTFVGDIGGAGGPVLAGRLFDITGSYQLGFLACLALGVIGLILALLLRPTAGEGGRNDPGGSA